MIRSADIISGPAESLIGVTPKVSPVINDMEEESIFNYPDTASSRAGIVPVSQKLAIGKVAIIGVDGMGYYILDLVAKTRFKEIHLFDGDQFLQDNAFRSPGASSAGDLGRRVSKAVPFLSRKWCIIEPPQW
jgi:hypothetical protein